MLVSLMVLIKEGVRLKASHLQHDLPQAPCYTCSTWQSQLLESVHTPIHAIDACMKYICLYMDGSTA